MKPALAPRTRRWILLAALGAGAAVLVGGCGSTGFAVRPGTIAVVAAENQYGDVAAQIGGVDVSVISVESNPNTDPHSYEVSPDVADEIGSAQVVIQNGIGYDDFMTKIEFGVTQRIAARAHRAAAPRAA